MHQGGLCGPDEECIQIPDELVDSVTATGDLPRRALEAFALEETQELDASPNHNSAKCSDSPGSK
jgi:hypothetical protein